MSNVNKVAHDLAMLYLEKTIDFEDILMDAAQLAVEYEMAYESAKSMLDVSLNSDET